MEFMFVHLFLLKCKEGEQNILVAITFDLKFTYVLAGWEGSVHFFFLIIGYLGQFTRMSTKS